MSGTNSRSAPSLKDYEDFGEREGQFITPQYDSVKAALPIEHMKLSLDDEDDSYPSHPVEGEDDDADDDEDEEPVVRVRSRSRSIHEMDGNNNGVVLIDPSTISNGSPSSELKTCDKERTGPLQLREVEALKKGIEEALPSRNPDELREEREDQIAATEEKMRRSALNQSSELRRIKILMLGDSGVGKSSLIIRWTQDTFSTDLVGTVGVNFKMKKVQTESGDSVQVQVWDTAGQEQFHKITTSYYKGANGIMLVYDVADKKSVENVEYWVKNIKSHASDSVQVALIGNKVDLRSVDPSKCVDSSYGQFFAQKFGVPYFETSAKDSTNVNEAFLTLVANITMNSDTCPHADRNSGGANGGGGQRKSIVDPKGKKKEKCIIS